MKNRYSFPRKPRGNNREFNTWYEDEGYKNETEPKTANEVTPHREVEEDGWRHNGVRHDIYHLPNEGQDYVEDDYTVGQKFEDRTQFTH